MIEQAPLVAHESGKARATWGTSLMILTLPGWYSAGDSDDISLMSTKKVLLSKNLPVFTMPMAMGLGDESPCAQSSEYVQAT